jgi:HEPN domain-containing protein
MPDRDVPDLHRQWLAKATEDLEAAWRLTDIPSACCFHCQQAVEKSIKALLVVHGVDFVRTHDIDVLLRQLRDQGVEPDEGHSEDLAALTRFAVDTRYPPETATHQEAAAALGVAERFVGWVAAKIPAVETGSEQPARTREDGAGRGPGRVDSRQRGGA